MPKIPVQNIPQQRDLAKGGAAKMELGKAPMRVASSGEQDLR